MSRGHAGDGIRYHQEDSTPSFHGNSIFPLRPPPCQSPRSVWHMEGGESNLETTVDLSKATAQQLDVNRLTETLQKKDKGVQGKYNLAIS